MHYLMHQFYKVSYESLLIQTKTHQLNKHNLMALLLD
jgi:hypothetical protein